MKSPKDRAMNKKIIFTAFIFVTFVIFIAKLQLASTTRSASLRVPQDFSTIQAAINAATTGDEIVVSDGTYGGFTLNKKVTVKAANFNQANPKQNTVRITGIVQVPSGMSWAWNEGPVVRGLYISTTDPVISNSPITIEYSYITGGGDGISFEPGGGGIARGNFIENMGDDAIDVDHQTKNVLVEDNYFLNSDEDGLETRQHGDEINQRVSLILRNNRIEGSGEDGIQIMDYDNFSNRHYLIERNLFLNNGMAAIGLNPGSDTSQDFSAASMPEPVYAINNNFIGNNAGISGGHNVVAVNNIFKGNKTFDLKNVAGSSIIKHNIFAANPALQQSNNLDSQTTTVADPKLSANYELQNDSPAIDKGISSMQHTYHYDGSEGGSAQNITEYVINLPSSSYNGSAPDLGWKEVGGLGPTPTPNLTPTPAGTAAPTSVPTATPIKTTMPTPVSTGIGGSILTIPVSEDATVVIDSLENFGDDNELNVDASPKTDFLLKYLVEGLNGRQVRSAKLRIYSTGNSDQGGSFYTASSDWDEMAVNSLDVPSPVELAGALGSVSRNNWYEIDVTSVITSDGRYSFRVSSTSSDGADYSSKEGSNPSELIVEVVDESEPKNGDANKDGKVDGLDYVIWLINYNTQTSGGASKGDFDNNGRVDGLDYVIWLNNYGG